MTATAKRDEAINKFLTEIYHLTEQVPPDMQREVLDLVLAECRQFVVSRDNPVYPRRLCRGGGGAASKHNGSANDRGYGGLCRFGAPGGTREREEMRGESFIIPGERLSRFTGLTPGNT